MYLTLIVEDNATFRQSLKEILHAQFPFMGIEEAADGKEALLKVDRFVPNLIFMDIKLPGENGLKITKRLKSKEYSGIIIMLTSYDLPEYRDAAYACGADYFLTKGTATGNEIVELVEYIMANGRRSTAPGTASNASGC